MNQPKNERVVFLSEGLELVGNLVIPNQEKAAGVLFLHGGGVGSKDRYQELQDLLYLQGYPSLAFDFRGVGESQGIFEESTLEKRLADAIAAYDLFTKHVKKIVVVGTSMGAHIAVRLTQERNVSGLILLYGAAYSQMAEDKPFTQELTQVLRKKDSWKSSLVFPILQDYPSPVLVMYGKKDTVIPKVVQQAYKQALKQSDTFIELSHAGHIILKAETENEEEDKREVFKEINMLLNKLPY